MNTLPAKPDNFGMATTLCLTILLAASCAAVAAPTMRFDAQGKFKIVQFTDTHWDSAQEKAAETLHVIDTVLDVEKPDLVVLTGDIVTPERDPLDDWRRLTARISGRKIPWAAVLGNHDDEKHGVRRRDIVKYVATLPGSLTQEGPESLGGTGNYVVTIAHNDSDAPGCVLYFLDSRAYPRFEAIRQCKEIPRHNHYDWISLDQITWYRETSRAFRAARDGTPMPALAFFHIPLHEYSHPALRRSLIGTREEEEAYGALNSGMFAAMLEEGDVMGVAVGHDHDNDYAGTLLGICLAYGRVSGLAGYGKLPRGARVIELREDKREFDSWIRTVEGDVVHRFRYPSSFVGQSAK